MKKTLLVLSLILLFTLSGCFYTYDEGISTKSTVTVVNLSDSYETENEFYTIFQFSDKPGIDYVNIEQFVYLVEDALVNPSIQTGKNLQVNFNLTGYFPISIQFNSDDNTFTTFDFSYGNYITDFVSGEVDYNFETVDYVYDGETTPLTIDFDEYNIDIARDENGMYVPLYIANLLLSGDMLKTYLYEDTLYLFDDPYQLVNIIQSKDKLETIYEREIVTATVDYMRLFFDYFYGLTEYKNIDSDDIIEQFDLDQVVTFTTLHRKLFALEMYLADFHTSFYDFGYYEQESYSFFFEESTQEVQDFYRDLYACSERYPNNEDILITETALGYTVVINSFTDESTVKLREELELIDDNKDVVIDLSCNTGGLLSSSLDLISYLTFNQFDINYSVPYSNEYITETIKAVERRQLSNYITVKTSGITYSAANLVASIIKDNKLAILTGENSLGGGAAVQIAVLPDSSIMSYSSQFVLLNSNRQYIENGIEVDQSDSFTILNNLDYNLTVLSSFEDGLDVTFDFQSFILEGVSFNNIEVQITSKDDYHLISKELYPASDFSITLPTMNLTNHDVTIYIQYQIEGSNFTYKEVLYTSYNQ